MRVQPYLNWLSENYDTARASAIAQQTNFKGGWEGWLQVEIAMTFLEKNEAQTCTREVPYPAPAFGQSSGQYITKDGTYTDNANAAARADFMLQRTGGSVDETYVELKCSNFKEGGNAVSDAWKRFFDDVQKITNVQAANKSLNCIATVCYYGSLPLATDGTNVTLAGLPAAWYSDKRRTYVWYCGVPFSPGYNSAVQSIDTVAAAFKSDGQVYTGLLMVGLSPTLD